MTLSAHWERPDAGKACRPEEEAAEDETVGWHHRLGGCEFEQTPGDDRGQYVLQSTGSQRAEHNLADEQQQQRHTKALPGGASVPHPWGG